MSITLIQEIGISGRLNGAKMSEAHKKMFRRTLPKSIAVAIERFIRCLSLKKRHYRGILISIIMWQVLIPLGFLMLVSVLILR